MAKTKLAVVFGGFSSEHDVSLRSAQSVIDHADRERFEIIPVGISKDGRWFYYSGELSHIGDGLWLDSGCCRSAFFAPDRSRRGLSVIGDDGVCELLDVDVVFPVLHGKNGEDGTIQGLFELAGLPYVGCGVLASAACMDKAVTNSLFDYNGIPHCKWAQLSAADMADFDAVAESLVEKLGLPLFVKPANAGSSVGVSRVEQKDALRAAVEKALREDSKVVVEECVFGHEVECAVLGNCECTASVVGEILPPQGDFYSYDEKYSSTSATGLRVPAAISAAASAEVRRLAVAAYRALGCSGLARCDFFVTNDDERVLINEINTLPGFTSISMYPRLMAESGVDFTSLITRLVELALQRGNR